MNKEQARIVLITLIVISMCFFYFAMDLLQLENHIVFIAAFVMSLASAETAVYLWKGDLNEILNQIGNTEIRIRETRKKLSEKAKPKNEKVRFTLFAPEAGRVFWAGDFNNWDVDDLPMKKSNKGIWETSFALLPRRHEYRFWVDGVWYDGPNAQERVENPFGSQNCIRIVS